MIFETFNNDIDKASAKIGILGKSFYDFVDIANKRKIKIDDLITYNGMTLEEAKEEAGSLWSNLFPSKASIQSQIIDVDELIPELSTDTARKELENLQKIQNQINATKGSWDDYNYAFKNGREYLLNYAKTNNVLESSVDNVKNANESARESAIAYNASLKAQTLSAKATAVALKALSVVGNILFSIAISAAISEIYKLTTAVKDARKAAKQLGTDLKESAEEIENFKSQIEDLSETINDETSSVNDVATARTNHLDIQDQMIEKYGKEAETIKLITEALNGESEAWNELAKKEYQEYVKEYDSDTNHWANFFAGGNLFTSKNSEVAVSQMENVEQDLISSFVKLYDDNRNSMINFAKQLDTAVYDSNTGTLKLVGNAYEVQEDLQKIESYATSIFNTDDKDVSSFLSSMDKVNSKVDEIVDSYRLICCHTRLAVIQSDMI